MEKKSDYQGWTNYETWAMAWGLNNDRDSHEFIIEQAKELLSESDTTRDSGSYSSADVALADTIKEMVEEGNPLADSASVYSDLLNGAIEEIDFREIAANFIDTAKEH